MSNFHYLSKTKLISGWQCPKRLWLELNEPDEKIVSAATEVLVDAVCERGTCDLVWDIAAWVPLIVIGTWALLHRAANPNRRITVCLALLRRHSRNEIHYENRKPRRFAR